MESHIVRHSVTNDVIGHFQGEVPRQGDTVLIPRNGEMIPHICDRVEWEILSRSRATIRVSEL